MLRMSHDCQIFMAVILTVKIFVMYYVFRFQIPFAANLYRVFCGEEIFFRDKPMFENKTRFVPERMVEFPYLNVAEARFPYIRFPSCIRTAFQPELVVAFSLHICFLRLIMAL